MKQPEKKEKVTVEDELESMLQGLRKVLHRDLRTLKLRNIEDIEKAAKLVLFCLERLEERQESKEELIRRLAAEIQRARLEREKEKEG